MIKIFFCFTKRIDGLNFSFGNIGFYRSFQFLKDDVIDFSDLSDNF